MSFIKESKNSLTETLLWSTRPMGTSGAPWRDGGRWSKVTNHVAWMEQVANENTNTFIRWFMIEAHKLMQQRNANR